MNLLFRAELLRFRGWALAFLVVHLGLLGFFARMADLAQLDWEQYAMIGTAYVLVGALFGLYQAGSYRRPNHWLKLLHRPLPRWRIAAALFGEALVAQEAWRTASLRATTIRLAHAGRTLMEGGYLKLLRGGL